MIKCKTYNCPAWGDWRCCVECERTNCSKRCQNHPDRCSNYCTDDEPKQKGCIYDHNQMLELARQGLTNARIADQLGCYESTVANALSKMGFRRRKKAGDNDG